MIFIVINDIVIIIVVIIIIIMMIIIITINTCRHDLSVDQTIGCLDSKTNFCTTKNNYIARSFVITSKKKTVAYMATHSCIIEQQKLLLLAVSRSTKAPSEVWEYRKLSPVSQMEVGCSRIWGLEPTTQTLVSGTPHMPALPATQPQAPPVTPDPKSSTITLNTVFNGKKLLRRDPYSPE